MYLTPRPNEDGAWRLFMYGRFDLHADDMARMWRRLNEMGMPTYLHGADDLANILLGEDWILLAPRHEYVDYMSGTEKFGRKVGLALYMDEEHEGLLVEAVEWMPIELPRPRA